jgi:hypothetical protein
MYFAPLPQAKATNLRSTLADVLEVISQAAADREIAVKLLDQGTHFAPPATGHSRATARSPSTSNLA